jgi:hypothetical protein
MSSVLDSEEMKIKITSVARPIDPSYPSNRAIAVLTIVVMVGGAIFELLTGGGWIESGLQGIGVGLAVFIAWALCRELDPDHDLSAFVAAGLALGGLFLWDLPHFGVLFWLLLMVRIVNRTPGAPATVLDSLAVLGLGGWLAAQGNWGYGAITALALFVDGRLSRPNRRQVLLAGLGVIVTVVAVIVAGELRWEGAPSLAPGLIGLGMAVLFVPVFLGARQLDSVGDETGEPLEPLRVQAGQGLALLAGVEAAFWGGEAGLVSLGPLWAAVLGASLYWVYVDRKG